MLVDKFRTIANSPVGTEMKVKGKIDTIRKTRNRIQGETGAKIVISSEQPIVRAVIKRTK